VREGERGREGEREREREREREGGREREVISNIHAHTQTVYQFLTDPEHKANIDAWASEVVQNGVNTRGKNI